MSTEAEAPPSEPGSNVFVLKTTINQERNVAETLRAKVRQHKGGALAILAPGELRGYVFVEALDREELQRLIRGLKHARGLVDGAAAIGEVEHFLTPKPSVEGIAEGDIVELVSGPFKGEKARVQRIDENKEEITVELFEAMVPIPVTVRGDHVRVLQKKDRA